jgi:hypothetical protein
MEVFYRLLVSLFWGWVMYVTGLIAIIPLLPFYRVESILRPRSNPYMWKSLGFTYHKGEKRYFYREAIQAIGGIVWVGLLAILVAS